MKKLIVLVVSAIGIATVLITSTGAAAGSSGHFFRRACDLPRASIGECGVQVVTNGTGVPLAAAAAPMPGSYGPAQFHTAYALPTTAPTTQTIAIVDAYNDQNIESDLATYSAQYGLPSCTTANGCFRKVNQFGGTSYPQNNANWALEIALDVETAHQICQNCKILLVEATSPSLVNLGTAENTAAALGANVISNSWGASEYSTETSDEASYFNHPGVAITASTGDNGYGVEFPASSRYVTAVGGTTLTLNGDNTRKSEAAWSGAGSGCSRYVPKPAWQSDTGCLRRTEADVSADADPNTGAAVYDSVPYQLQSGWFQVGGTSLAAPLIAGVYALTGTASAVSYGSAPYAHTGSLNDITSGSNGTCSPAYLCHGVAGYDGPTGLGTPNGLAAFMAGSGGPTPDFSVGVSPSSSTVTQGTNGSFSISVGSSGGFSGSVSLSQSGLPNGSFSPASVGAPGSSTLTINTSATAPGSYPFTVTGTNGSTTHSASATLVVQAAASGDFSISVSPTSAVISRTSTTTYNVTVTPQNGFSAPVALSASGFTTGLSGSFSPNPTSSSSTFTITAVNASSGRGSITITISGTGGGKTHATTLRLYIF